MEMIPVLIGLFAVTEVLKQTNPKKRLSAEDGVGNNGKVNTKMPSLKELWVLDAPQSSSFQPVVHLKVYS